MECWSTGGPGHAAPDGIALRLIGAVGDPSFPRVALDALDGLVSSPYVTAYRKRAGAPVAMRFAGTLRDPDITRRCWTIYRKGPHRHDRSFDAAVERARPEGLGWCHLTAEQIDDPMHRVHVYERHGLTDRLSIVEPSADGEWFALNFFRVQGQGHFADRELARLESVAPLLMALARRHEALTPSDDPLETAQRIARVEERLAQHPAGLPARERAVCARLAIGMTYDGIAADLGIAATSAKTYRNRAFERLGIRFRSELAKVCWAA